MFKTIHQAAPENARLQSQKGTIGAVSGLAFGVCLMMASLAIDTGYIFTVQSQLQNAADAAALAAITKIPVTADAARKTSKDIAKEYLAGGKAVVMNDSDVELGRYDFDRDEFQVGATPINAARVRTFRNENVPAGKLPLFLGQFVGVREVSLEQSAMAVIDPRVVGVMANNHLIPYSVIDTLVDQNGDGDFDIGRTINILLRNGADRGNFGFLNLDGGNLGTDELRVYIIHGFNQDFVIPESGFHPVSGDTGIRGNSLLDAFEQVYYDFGNMQGAIVYMPVHRSWSGQGANAIFEVIDIVALKIRSVQLNGNINSRKIEAEITHDVSSGFIEREGADANNSLQKLRLIA